MSDKFFVPQNKNAQDCVKNVMKYLSDITYEKVITGQHTQSMAQEELHYIEQVTGKQPALLGFELLSYSPNINYTDTDDECMKEVEGNYGTLKRAWEWADKKGLITFTWHWFSPLGGRSKSFFTVNTDFDASKAVIEGTPENTALISDMDMMAGLLRPFCDKQIPILWRPFHEGEGDWFWWGAKGADAYKELYRYLYDQLTNKYGCHNLIWVWNGQNPDWYPGDEYVDIIGEDIYPDAHAHSSESTRFLQAAGYTESRKMIVLSENGTMPDPDLMLRDGTLWGFFATWSGDFVIHSGTALSNKYTDEEMLKKIFTHDLVLTREEVPDIRTWPLPQ